MIVTVLKIYLQKREAKVINYRDYQNFSNEDFRQQVLKNILKATQNGNIVSYESFLSICQRALDSRAPKKPKYVRSNYSPFINKTILKAITDRSRLRNKFLKTRSNEDKKAYNTQRNYCLTLDRKAKKDYYNNLDHGNVTDNKTFWKSIKPFFSEKGSTHNKITSVEQDLILDKKDNVAEVLNKFFINLVSNLNISKYHEKSVNIDHIEDPIARSIEKYKNHPSIVAIKSKIINKYFKFNSISKAEIEKEILNLDSSKACQDSDIPTKVIKSNSDIFTDALYSEFNRSLETSVFPPSMKLANVTPVHKKGNRSEEDNFWPASILPNLSKVYERCIYNQIAKFFDKILSKHQCGFRKGHSAQHSLIVLLEKWKESVDQGHVFRALLTDLSKAFDCIPQNILIAKFNAYGFGNKAVRFLYDYLTSRKQRTKISDTYSSWQYILLGVPKVQYLDHYNSTLTYAIYFLS